MRITHRIYHLICNMERTCKCCGEVLQYNDFYKTRYGYDYTCKKCRKRRIHEKYLEKSKSEEFMEKERARGREKYKRLGYKDKISKSKLLKEKKYPSLRNARRDFHCTLSSSIELHHWNYNISNSIIAMDRTLHHRLHTSITLDIENGIYLFNGEKLDSLEKHLNVIKMVCDKNGFDFSEVKVL